MDFTTKPVNRARRGTRVGLIMCIIGLLLMFVPMNMGLDGFDGGFGLAFIGFFIVIMGVVTWFIYNKIVKAFDQVVSGQDMIVQWNYQPDQWRTYAEYDYKETASNNKRLFYIVAGISVVIGIIFLIADPEAGGVVCLILLGLIAIIGLTAYLSTQISYSRNMKRVGEVWIHPKGIILNGAFHPLGVAGSKLERVQIVNEAMLIIEIEYSAPGKNSRNYYTIRVPVPYGQEYEAESVVRKLLSFHNVEIREKLPDEGNSDYEND